MRRINLTRALIEGPTNPPPLWQVRHVEPWRKTLSAAEAARLDVAESYHAEPSSAAGEHVIGLTRRQLDELLRRRDADTGQE